MILQLKKDDGAYLLCPANDEEELNSNVSDEAWKDLIETINEAVKIFKEAKQVAAEHREVLNRMDKSHPGYSEFKERLIFLDAEINGLEKSHYGIYFESDE
jgi:hypothetical protein